MKILHVSPELAAGNGRQMAADLAAALHGRGEGTECALFAPVRAFAHELAACGVKRYDWKGGCNILATWRATRRLRRLLMHTKIDVAVAYSAAALTATVRAAGQVPTRRRPRIVALLSTHPRHAAAAHVLAQADAAVVVSASLAKACELRHDFLRGKGKHAVTRTAVIPYGVDERLCHPAYTAPETWLTRWQRRHPQAAGRFTLCVPAPLSPLHGQEALVPLMNALKRSGVAAHAFLVGNAQAADPAYVARLHRQFEAAELEGSVSWVNPAQEEMRNILAACDVTLSLAQQPATQDRAILEALCLGRPVAGYDHGAVGEMLSAFLPEGRVSPGDVHALADTLTQWHAYRPDMPAAIPPPYRLEDSAEALHALCCELHAAADAAQH